MEPRKDSIFQVSRNSDDAETASTNVQTPEVQSSARDATTKSLAYRLRGIPSNIEQHGVEELVRRVLELGHDIAVDVNSLADDPSRPGRKIATLEFSKIPDRLSEYTDNWEWQFSLFGNQQNDRERSALVFDTHFKGLTPLHSRSDAECDVESV